jgi:hypothetical protein
MMLRVKRRTELIFFLWNIFPPRFAGNIGKKALRKTEGLFGYIAL